MFTSSLECECTRQLAATFEVEEVLLPRGFQRCDYEQQAQELLNSLLLLGNHDLCGRTVKKHKVAEPWIS